MLNHPIETTIKNWLFGVPGWYVISSCWRGPHLEMQVQNPAWKKLPPKTNTSKIDANGRWIFRSKMVPFFGGLFSEVLCRQNSGDCCWLFFDFPGFTIRSSYHEFNRPPSTVQLPVTWVVHWNPFTTERWDSLMLRFSFSCLKNEAKKTILHHHLGNVFFCNHQKSTSKWTNGF